MPRRACVRIRQAPPPFRGCRPAAKLRLGGNAPVELREFVEEEWCPQALRLRAGERATGYVAHCGSGVVWDARSQTYSAGWDAVRADRHRRMQEKGILPPGNRTLAPRHDAAKQWKDNPTKVWDARAMAVHAAMVDRMDQGIGWTVAKLREMKLLDNTVILFLSDNGASPEAYPNPGFDRPAETRDGRKISYPPARNALPGPDDTFFGIGRYWASVSNTPLRAWKAEMHEGGICTPMEGQSLVPVFRGENGAGDRVMAWEHFGARAIRQGDWKLVAQKAGPWELYDVSNDRGELNDVAVDRPQIVRDLEAKWQRWARRTNVYPTPDEPGRSRKAR